MKLTELNHHTLAKITSINTPDKKTKHRLADMGLIKDTIVEIKKISPLGDPIDIFLRGYELVLRKKECSYIEVEVI